MSNHSELELANAKIAELKQRLQTYQNQEETLIPLPNKDLHRGFRKFVTSKDNIEGAEVIPESDINPLDRAMAKCLRAMAPNEPLSCLWCGLQLDEKKLREHLTKDHPSVVDGWNNATSEVLMANLAEANAALAAK